MPRPKLLCQLWCERHVEYYLDSAKCQLHDFFLSKRVHIMECYCKRPLIMSLSQSERNPGRLFLKCPKRWCDFFQWVDEEPRGKTKAWLEGGRIQEGCPKPQELFIPQQKDFQMVQSVCREIELLKNVSTCCHWYPLIECHCFISVTHMLSLLSIN